MKKRLVSAGFIFAVLLLLSVPSWSASEYCAHDRVNQNLYGKWKGSDSYYFLIKSSRDSQLCISILEDGTTTERFIRDIVVINGSIKHLSYHTPLTKAYVVYTNIEIVGNEMRFDWYSSYNNRSGKGVYYRLSR